MYWPLAASIAELESPSPTELQVGEEAARKLLDIHEQVAAHETLVGFMIQQEKSQEAVQHLETAIEAAEDPDKRSQLEAILRTID